MESRTDKLPEFDAPLPDAGDRASSNPVDRLPRRQRRNKICVAIIAIGMLNFVVYTFVYAAVGGDAHNGEARLVEQTDNTPEVAYFVRGHFLRSLQGQETRVSRSVWIYSYLHSMSVFVTSAAMIISMLVLARPHIIATMRDGWIGGRTFVNAFGIVVVLIVSTALFIFAWEFIAQLRIG